MGTGKPVVAPAEGREIGRPPNDHRTVSGGIPWVARTGSSWREMPEEYGKWETAHRRQEPSEAAEVCKPSPVPVGDVQDTYSDAPTNDREVCSPSTRSSYPYEILEIN
jgi:hypothetical protein